MKNCIVLCVFVCLANCLPADFYKTEWIRFKDIYGKQYSTEREENVRFNIFSKNLEQINEHNKQYELGLTSYKMTVNEFIDLTEEEFQKMLGFLPNSNTQLTEIDYHQEWENFKSDYNRVYSSEEDKYRFEVFSQNLAKILKHNDDYKNGLTTFKIGVNNFSDMTSQEMKKYMGTHRLEAQTTVSGDMSADCKPEWRKFKEAYDRTFTSSEEGMRFEIFCNNFHYVQKHNEDFAKGLTTFNMTINQFSDRTTEEIKKMMGYRGKVNNGLSFRTNVVVDDTCRIEYEEFKKTYSKVHQSTEEEMIHLKTFCKNMETIRKHNEQYDLGLTSFKMGVNKFTDMTPDEMKQYLGLWNGENLSSSSESTNQSVYQMEWQTFKETFGKSYSSQEEEQMRYNVFCQNMDEIVKHNKLYENGDSTFKMAVNKFTDLTHEEFQELLRHGL